MQKTLKTPPQNLLELLGEFSNVGRYKINVQISSVFLYSNNDMSESKNKKFLLKSLSKKKHLRNKPDLGGERHTENYKTLMKEI